MSMMTDNNNTLLDNKTQTKNKICNDFMYNKCKRTLCKFEHNEDVCFYFWAFGECRNDTTCKKSHNFRKNASTKIVQPKEIEHNIKSEQPKGKKTKLKGRRVKNTESFEPMTRPVDMRITYDFARDKLSDTSVLSRDVLLVPNLFSDFETGEIYKRLINEIGMCSNQDPHLLKLWHGDTHLIADDHRGWKSKCPTFAMVIDRIAKFFSMDIRATRFNWYKDQSQWKPFHHDAAAVKKDKMNTQNFTVGISFGATREAAFEHAVTKTTISIPQTDGCIYAFAKDTNIIWKHGILQKTTKDQDHNTGRISVIAWGWINNQHDM